MKKICVVFPYSMGNDFMSGGVTKLVIENLIAAKNNYETYLLMPINNEAFKEYVNVNIPEIKVRLVDFDFIAQYADTSNVFKRVAAILKRTIRALAKRKNLINAIEQIKPDIVHLHAEVTFMFMKMIKEKGYTIIFHTSSIRFAENKLLRKIVSDKAYKYADYIISPTKSIDNLYMNKRKYVVENPIVKQPQKQGDAIIESSFTNDNRIKLIFTGRICRVKQIHYLVEVLGKLNKKYLDQIAVYIIGKANNDGDKAYYDEILDEVNKKNITNIYFLGYKTNVNDYLKYADVGVLLSKSEAISMSCVEYMNAGLLVLGFNNPGINEAVVDKYNGRLIEDGDVNGLVRAVETFVDMKDDLKQMKINAKKYAEEHFSTQVFENNLRGIYEEILDGKDC